MDFPWDAAEVIDRIASAIAASLTIIGVLDWSGVIPTVPYVSPEWWLNGGSILTFVAALVLWVARRRDVSLSDEGISQKRIWGEPCLICWDDVLKIDTSHYWGITVYGKYGVIHFQSGNLQARAEFLDELKNRFPVYPPPRGDGPNFVTLEDQWKVWQ